MRAYDLCTSFPKTVLADPGQTLAEVPPVTLLSSIEAAIVDIQVHFFFFFNSQAGLLNAVIIQQLK